MQPRKKSEFAYLIASEHSYLFQSLLAFKTPHQVSLGQLWLELLKFYTLEFALEEYVISIRVQELLTRENKNWPKRRIAIEGGLIPFSHSVVCVLSFIYPIQVCHNMSRQQTK